MKDTIKSRIGELSEEAKKLMEERKSMLEQIQKIDIRMTQIASGIQELDALITPSETSD